MAEIIQKLSIFQQKQNPKVLFQNSVFYKDLQFPANYALRPTSMSPKPSPQTDHHQKTQPSPLQNQLPA
jgi:hypothetical protein